MRTIDMNTSASLVQAAKVDRNLVELRGKSSFRAGLWTISQMAGSSACLRSLSEDAANQDWRVGELMTGP
jgi:predicted secreted protein